MTAVRKIILSLAVLLLSSLALAQGTYTEVDVPGALTTAGFGIDTAGDMIGLYVDASGNYHGFLLSGTTFSTIDYPGAPITYLFGINDLGQIVGYGNAGNSGFSYDVATQAFTPISYPHANRTFPTAINNAGTIVGSVIDLDNETLGFELVGSRYRQISPPGTFDVSLAGITESGKIVGTVSNIAGTKNFLFNHGNYGHLTIPGASGAVVAGINPAGTAMVGNYTHSSGITAGFLYQGKTLTTLQFPGSNTTYAIGINSAGEVAGYFIDASGNLHGFLWTPAR
jgi:probable HAF family extracellular repeat protein